MKRLKIKPIKTITEVRDCFAFFKNIHFLITQTETEYFSTFHETYRSMLDNLQRKQRFQFYAEIDDQIVGCIVAFPDADDENFISIPVLAVDVKHRHLGIGSQLLEELVSQLKGPKHKTLQIKSSQSFIPAIERLGFEPSLYVDILPPVTTEQILAANNNELEVVSTTPHYVKFKVENYDESLVNIFKRKIKPVFAGIIFERQI